MKTLVIVLLLFCFFPKPVIADVVWPDGVYEPKPDDYLLSANFSNAFNNNELIIATLIIVSNFAINLLLLNFLLLLVKLKASLNRKLIYALLFSTGGYFIDAVGMRFANFDISATKTERIFQMMPAFGLISVGLGAYCLALNYLLIKAPRVKSILVAVSMGILASPFWTYFLDLDKYFYRFWLFVHRFF